MGAPKIPYLAVHIPDGVRVMLYRFFDSSGRLLYVGITDDPHVRWAAHARRNAGTWWPHVCVVHTEWFPTRSTAEAAETAAIRSESPLHNVSHNHKLKPGRRVRSMFLHPLARERFGDAPFTNADLAGELGIPYGTVLIYGRRLVEQGAFQRVGMEPGSRRGLFVALDITCAAAASPVKAPLPHPQGDGA